MPGKYRPRGGLEGATGVTGRVLNGVDIGLNTISTCTVQRGPLKFGNKWGKAGLRFWTIIISGKRVALYNSLKPHLLYTLARC